jgi:diguanylate cyclase (GGDEF)-like protein/PAS domain S-box-containing protein
MVQVASVNGILRYVNRAWRRALGYENRDVTRLLLLDLIHPDHQQIFGDTMRDVIQQQTAISFDSTLLTRAGEPLAVTGTIDCQLASGSPVLLRAVMREAYSDANRDLIDGQWLSIFESPAIGMAVQSLDGRWLAVNDALAEMLGYSPNELITMTFHDITHPDDIAENADLLQRLAIGSERRFQMEKRYIHRNGSLVSAILTVSVVTDRYGNPLRFVSQVQDITARTQLETQLMYKASHDVLTGLPNRALFMDRLEHALQRLQRDNGQIAVMFLDLDGFKAVNDQYGHDQGDRLLVEIGRRLRACARAGDTVARLGGDEFTILLEQVRHPSIATEVAQRVRETLAYPIMLGEHVTTISPSIGIVISSGTGDTAEAILHDADTAMYQAKRTGKDRAVLAVRQVTGVR